jgi:hypothetical protein
MIKLSAEELAPSMTKLLNFVINSGEYPTSWKKGEWTPVHKKTTKQIRRTTDL